jgi:glutamine phosphoribosylpyrophosphate amidotransferase
VLTRFIARHEQCLAAAAKVETFDIVTLVPASTPQRVEARWRLRWILETGCAPLAARVAMLLAPTPIAAQGKTYSPQRYAATKPLDGKRVLLVDDTWTKGDSAQSAAAALRIAGAHNVAMLVIGRHLDPSWEPIYGSGTTNADVLKHAPRFMWSACAYEL